MSESPRIEVIVGAHDDFTRAGLRAALSTERDIYVVADTANNDDAIRQSARLKPHVVILDGALADSGVVESCRSLRVQAPDTHVIVLIHAIEPAGVVNAVRAGADGCLAESSRVEDVRRIVRAVAVGEAAFDPHVTRMLLDHLRRHPPTVANGGTALTTAQCRALRLVAAGKTNREIALDLAVSEKTVKNWLAHAFGKLHVSRRAEAAVRFAVPQVPVEAPAADGPEPPPARHVGNGMTARSLSEELGDCAGR
jgi:two-component system, NarL family, response regulator DevR